MIAKLFKSIYDRSRIRTDRARKVIPLKEPAANEEQGELDFDELSDPGRHVEVEDSKQEAKFPPSMEKNHALFIKSIQCYIHCSQQFCTKLGQFQMYQDIINCYISEGSPYQVGMTDEIREILLKCSVSVESFTQNLPTKRHRLHVFDESFQYIRQLRKRKLAHPQN